MRRKEIDVVDEVRSSGPFRRDEASYSGAEMDHHTRVWLETCRHLGMKSVFFN